MFYNINISPVLFMVINLWSNYQKYTLPLSYHQQRETRYLAPNKDNAVSCFPAIFETMGREGRKSNTLNPTTVLHIQLKYFMKEIIKVL